MFLLHFHSGDCIQFREAILSLFLSHISNGGITEGAVAIPPAAVSVKLIYPAANPSLL